MKNQIQFIHVGEGGTRAAPELQQTALAHFTQQGTNAMSIADNESGISIDVSGPPDSGKTLVCSIIARSLSKAGFTNVVMSDQQGEVVEPGEIRTMLDLVATARPEILRTAIEVTETTVLPEEDSDIIELSDMTLRVAPEDLTEFDALVTEAGVLEES
jgi:hypothetical protein